MDTGCGHNIVSHDYVRHCGARARSVPREHGHSFQGVSGITTCTSVVELPLHAFGTQESFWISGSSPALASVGKRVEDGCSFVWPRDGAPYFITASGQRVSLLVDRRIPYYDPQSPACRPVPAQERDFVVPAPPGDSRSCVASCMNATPRQVLSLSELVPAAHTESEGEVEEVNQLKL